MRKVFTNAGVAHVWAQQTQQEGRNGHSSLFFDGDTIYSYGHHFPIARFLTPDIVLFTTEDSSVTTSQHKSLVARAVNHKEVIPVPDVKANCDEDHKDNYNAMSDGIRRMWQKAERATKWTVAYLREIKQRMQFQQRYYDVVGLYRVLQPVVYPSFEPLEARAKAQHTKALAQAEELAKKQAIENEHCKAFWEAWENGRNSMLVDGKPISITQIILRKSPHSLLRIKERNENRAVVETSQGVRIVAMSNGKVLPFVRLLYKLCKKCVETEAAYRPEKVIRIGDSFTLHAILDNGTAIIGCHNIQFRSIERICKQLGLAD